MSSFVINKKDYARLAGVLAGIGTQKDYHRDQVFYRCEWDGHWWHQWEKEDFRKDVMSLYDLNLKSVCLQYGDTPDQWERNPIEQAELNYEFETYFLKASKLYRLAHGVGTIQDVKELEKLLYYINDFFRSVNYQIEDEEASNKANKIMDYYRSKILDMLKHMNCTHETLSWGDFSFFNPEEQR